MDKDKINKAIERIKKQSIENRIINHNKNKKKKIKVFETKKTSK